MPDRGVGQRHVGHEGSTSGSGGYRALRHCLSIDQKDYKHEENALSLPLLVDCSVGYRPLPPHFFREGSRPKFTPSQTNFLSFWGVFTRHVPVHGRQKFLIHSRMQANAAKLERLWNQCDNRRHGLWKTHSYERTTYLFTGHFNCSSDASLPAAFTL